jgi:hypothetical protein
MLQARKLAPAIRAARCARLGDQMAAAKGAGSDHMHVQALGGHSLFREERSAPVPICSQPGRPFLLLAKASPPQLLAGGFNSGSESCSWR